jgi:addiction module RelE/StbE family toxin
MKSKFFLQLEKRWRICPSMTVSVSTNAFFLWRENPKPPAALPLKGAGRGLWRVRVGDYRILYEIHDTHLIVIIVDIGNRRDVYRGL